MLREKNESKRQAFNIGLPIRRNAKLIVNISKGYIIATETHAYTGSSI